MNAQDREMVIHYISEARRIAMASNEGMLAYILDLALEETERTSKAQRQRRQRIQ